MVEPQYTRALDRANKVRTARAELKRRIHQGELDVADVILVGPWEAEGMAIADLLMAQRRWGDTRVRSFLRQVPMSEKKTIGSMTERQRRTLAAMLSVAARRPAARAVPLLMPHDFEAGDERPVLERAGDLPPAGGAISPTDLIERESARLPGDRDEPPPADPTEQDVAVFLNELREVGDRCERLGDELKSETLRRDALIAAASLAGASRRTVADAAHITVGRVQQIVSRRPAPPAARHLPDPVERDPEPTREDSLRYALPRGFDR